eukprot:scaffold90134_cov51-Cyclotella_meneghiniana.AAC.6
MAKIDVRVRGWGKRTDRGRGLQGNATHKADVEGLGIYGSTHRRGPKGMVTVTVLISNTATRCGVMDVYHLVEYIVLSAKK